MLRKRLEVCFHGRLKIYDRSLRYFLLWEVFTFIPSFRSILIVLDVCGLFGSLNKRFSFAVERSENHEENVPQAVQWLRMKKECRI